MSTAKCCMWDQLQSVALQCPQSPGAVKAVLVNPGRAPADRRRVTGTKNAAWRERGSIVRLFAGSSLEGDTDRRGHADHGGEDRDRANAMLFERVDVAECLDRKLTEGEPQPCSGRQYEEPPKRFHAAGDARGLPVGSLWTPAVGDTRKFQLTAMNDDGPPGRPGGPSLRVGLGRDQ